MKDNGTTVDRAVDFARGVLEEVSKREVKLAHSFNYMNGFKGSGRKAFRERDEKLNAPVQNQIIYTTPGKARNLEVVQLYKETRAGVYPQHNSEGGFSHDIEQLPSISFAHYESLLTKNDLLESGFKETQASITKKHFYKLVHQFEHMKLDAFAHMVGIDKELKQRDYDIWLKTVEQDDSTASRMQTQTELAFLSEEYEFLQFVQIVTRDLGGSVSNLKHVVFDAGAPIVINESRIDEYGRMRQIAHVGDWGGQSEYLNSVERFDDGSIVWTLTEQRKKYPRSASAVLLPDGSIETLKKRDNDLYQAAARNLGAEGINPRTGKWTGRYDKKACCPETRDKYVMRNEYKENIRKQVYQIIDGAAIPGLLPVFDCR